MKKMIMAMLITVFLISTVSAQSYNVTPQDDQAQEEKNLEILSKRLVRMKKEMDKFVKDMSATYQDNSSGVMDYGSDVKVDIVENDKNFTVTADLPGMDKDKIDIVLEKGRILKLSGIRNVEKRITAPGVVKQERMEGRFERVLELPADCKSEGISAAYNNGVLVITILKAEPVKADTVKVKVQ